MAKVRDVLQTVERLAPAHDAFDFDRIGLLIGDPDATVTKVAVSLERSLAAVDFAQSIGAELLLTHHPIFFRPLTHLVTSDHESKTAFAMISANISLITAHTNWDAAIGGINDELVRLLNLQDAHEFGSSSGAKRLKIVTFVPPDHADGVIDAATMAGAGIVGKYDRCAFMSDGTGTFTPRHGSEPTVGRLDDRTTVAETRIEMSLPESARAAVEQAVRSVHPYEVPVIHFLILSGPGGRRMGRIGTLSAPTDLLSFAEAIERQLSTSAMAWGPNSTITRVAVVGGAADGEWSAAQAAGADVLVTGEVKQHIALEASESGFRIIAAGHYATEHPGCDALAIRMALEMPEIAFRLFTPPAGQAGRPW